jgi:ribosomal protein L35AE/L33A
VPVLGDVLDEADETFTVGLSSASGATIADGQGVATIRDDDATPSLTVSDASVTEGDTGTTSAVFTVSLSAASGLPVTVAYATADGTAVAGGDYTATSGTLTFPAGTTTRTVSVSVLGDLVSEPTETFSLNLSQPANATLARSQGVGTITDNDAVPALSVNDVSVVEGNSGTVAAVFTVSLSAPSPLAVTVDYATADGTAAAGSDYTAKSGTLTFAAGVTTQTVSVLVTGDTVAEAAETFTLTLSHASGATVARAQGVGTIVDDDGRSISINDVSITEGNSGTANATFTVRLSSAATSTVTVAYATANGTATAGSDYTAKSGTLTFAAGATTQTVSVPVIGDTLDEADETFLVNLSSPVNATIADAQGVGTIVDNDPTPSLTVADVSVTEGNSGSVNAVFTVKLSAASGQSVSVAYATADSTATAGSDYAAKSGTLTFAPGTTSQTVSVSVLGDTTYEANETFLFNLSSPVNATLSRSQAVGTIVNDDSAPTTSVTINCWDDASQSPVLATTTNANDINLTDGRWTEFLYTSGRTFPTVCAGASEYENNGLQPMRFFKTGLANGTYQVFANLYTGDAGRNMRYYWGYSATDTKHYSVDTVGGSGGSTQHTEYLLGTVTISDGTFSLYAQDADVLSGSYSVFGWAWIRLVQTS